MADKYSFIVVKYPKQDTGEAALAAVIGLSKENIVKLRDAVAITKTPKGKIKLHQTKDDGAKQGFLKGGLIGVIFALLFGPAGWIVAGAALGTAFSLFDRGIKDKLLKELGEKMTPEESGLAVLVEEADWNTALTRMASYNFNGTIVVQETVGDAGEEIEKFLASRGAAAEPVPEEVSVEAPSVDEMTGEASADAPSADEGASDAEAAPADDAPAEEAPAEGDDSEEKPENG
jgi:uncharacterized membrane protein